LGSFLGTFFGVMLADIFSADAYPIWTEAIGIVLGCLLGILVPKLILSNSHNAGLNKVSAKTVFMG